MLKTNDNIRLTVPARELEFYALEGLHPIVGALVKGTKDIYNVEIEQKETNLLLLANRHIGRMERPPQGRVVQMNSIYRLHSTFKTAIN